MQITKMGTGNDAEFEPIYAALTAAGSPEKQAKVFEAWAAICERRAKEPRWFIPPTMPAVLRHVDDQAEESEQVPAPEAYGMSPTLAVCLDLWGQVVAHRVACRASIEWSGEGRTERDRIGLDLKAWQLQRDWRRAVGNEVSLPPASRPSEWAVSVAASKAGDELDVRLRRALQGLTRTVGPRATQAAYLTVHGLLKQDYLWRAQWAVKGPCLLTWLFAVPHLYGQPTDVSGWCFLRYGERCSDDSITKAERVLKTWAHHAKGHVATAFPTTFDAITTPVAPRAYRVA